MTRRNHETRLQIVLVQYLRLVLPAGAVLWHVPNGGKMSEASRKLKAAMGEKPGVSDLMFIWRGRLHCLEVKLAADPVWQTTKTYQTSEQKDFEREVINAGGRYAVVRSTGDARDWLAAWGIPTRETSMETRKPGEKHDAENIA